jgi:CHC2 zinc finger
MPMISPDYTILEVLQRWGGFQLATQARVKGALEYHGSCPFCAGSHDSCIVRPQEGTFSHAVRSGGCGRYGDAVDFLMQFCHMGFAQACTELGIDTNNIVSSTPRTTTYDDNAPPPLQWQKTAMTFCERAAKFLWTTHPAAIRARDYLMNERCLSEEIIKLKKLGCCPLAKNGRWYGEDPAEGGFEHWGLTDTDIDNPKILERGTILIPPGIVIPWIQEKQEILWKVEIKRFEDPNNEHRFGQIVGSKNGIYNTDTIDYNEPVMMVESSLCALSIEQVAGDLTAAIATGGTSGGRNRRFYPLLFSLPNVILQSFDNESKGDAGARYWLPLIGEHGFRYRPELAKDPNAMLQLQKQHDNEPILRSWVEWGLEMHELKMRGELPEEIPTKPDPPPQAGDSIAAYASQETFQAFWTNAFTDIEKGFPYQTHGTNPDTLKDYQRFMHVQEIGTPGGRGHVWDDKSIYAQIRRGYVRVALPVPTGHYQGIIPDPDKETQLYPIDQLIPLTKENK